MYDKTGINSFVFSYKVCLKNERRERAVLRINFLIDLFNNVY